MSRGRPKGSKDGCAAARPTPFRITTSADGHWLIKTASHWRHAKEISVLVPMLTVGREFVGDGVVTRTRGDCFVVTP